MKTITHVIVSSAIGVLLYFTLSSAEAFIMCLLMGVFLDVDHFIDYLWRSDDRSLRKFVALGPAYFDNPHSTDKFLHSIELFSLVVVPLMFYQPMLGIGLAAGFIGHIVLDFLGFGFSPFHFFLLYRATVEKGRILSLREAVLKRDGFTCRDCGATDKLQIHRGFKIGRIKGWNRVDEWTTVCEKCHVKRHGSGLFY